MLVSEGISSTRGTAQRKKWSRLDRHQSNSWIQGIESEVSADPFQRSTMICSSVLESTITSRVEEKTHTEVGEDGSSELI